MCIRHSHGRRYFIYFQIRSIKKLHTLLHALAHNIFRNTFPYRLFENTAEITGIYKQIRCDQVQGQFLPVQILFNIFLCFLRYCISSFIP